MSDADSFIRSCLSSSFPSALNTSTEEQLSSSPPDSKVSRRILSRIPQVRPIKGILKSPRLQKPSSSSIASLSLPHRLYKSNDLSHSSIPYARPLHKSSPSVEFSEKNAVTIFGDTSDENCTEAEGANPAPLFLIKPTVSPTAVISPIRQTNILFSEDSEESEVTKVPSSSASFLGGNYQVGEKKRDVSEQPSQDASTEEDAYSMTSSGSSHIMGKWWFGKDTRYVLHCDKHGHHHKHGENFKAEEYVTPTQRKSREIKMLSKELMKTKDEVLTKDKNLAELRERLKEIETMIGSSPLLTENLRLLEQLREQEEEFREEKQILIDKHEIRVRQLIQEIFDTRSEMLKKSQQLSDLQISMDVDTQDKGEMTEEALEGHEDEEGLVIDSLQPPDGITIGGESSPKVQGLPLSQRAGKAHQQYQLAVAQETITQLEAYRNEALIWRTKAAQLEIVVKDMMTKNEEIEQKFNNDLDKRTMEVQKLKETVRRMSTVVQPQSEHTLVPLSPAPAECLMHTCIERKRKLIDENNNLLEKINSHTERNNNLAAEFSTLLSKHEKKKKELAALESLHRELGSLAEQRLSETKAAQMAIGILQTEKDTLRKALDYLEGRCQVYQNLILDNNLVVQDESTANWKRGFSDTQLFSVLVSKRVQTEMTSEELSSRENEFVVLQAKLKEVEAEFSQKQTNLHHKFVEIEQNLFLKTTLVEKLTRQLEMAAKEAQISAQLRQTERDAYQKKINELGRQAERVPLLESENERSLKEKSLVEIKFRKVEKDFEENFERSMAESLKKFQNQSNYWKEKIFHLEKTRSNAMAHLDKLQRDFEELKLRHKIECAELEQRLASSIQHISALNNRLNLPRRDAMCDARPKTNSKYVACKPNSRHKGTEIEKDSLFDEVAFSLAYCRNELSISKKRTEELQTKLLDATLKLNKHSDKNKRVSGLSFDKVFFDREQGEVTLSCENSEDSKDEISMLSMPTILEQTMGNSESTNLTPSQLINGKPAHMLDFAKENKLVKEFKAVYEQTIRQLNDDKESLAMENAKLVEKVKKLDAELVQWHEKEKVSVSHVSCLIPSRLVTAGNVFEDTQIINLQSLDSEQDSHHPLRSNSLPRSRPSLPSTNHSKAPTRKGSLTSIAPANKWGSKQRRTCNESQIFHQMERLKKTVGGLLNKGTSPRKGVERRDSEDWVELKELQIICVALEAELKQEKKTSRSSEVESVKKSCAKLERRLLEAEMELEIYRTEPRANAVSHQLNDRLLKSRSVEPVDALSTNPEDLKKWKETAGVTFREVNYLRKAFAISEQQRLDYKTQIAMLKGEIVMNKCQARLLEEIEQQRSNIMSRKSIPGRHPSPLKTQKGRQIPKVRFLGDSLDLEMASSSIYSHKNDQKAVETNANHHLMTSSFHEFTDEAIISRESSMFDHKRLERREALALEGRCSVEKEMNILREAFRTQVSTLRSKNQELEKRVENLEEKNEEKLSAEKVRLTVRVVDLESENSLLKTENEMYEHKIREVEGERQQMYYVMFKKGQQAAAHIDLPDNDIDQMTEDKISLKFLHDAFYYFLLNKGNSREHIQAIMTMLNFTNSQKEDVYRRRGKSN